MCTYLYKKLFTRKYRYNSEDLKSDSESDVQVNWVNVRENILWLHKNWKNGKNIYDCTNYFGEDIILKHQAIMRSDVDSYNFKDSCWESWWGFQ